MRPKHPKIDLLHAILLAGFAVFPAHSPKLLPTSIKPD